MSYPQQNATNLHLSTELLMHPLLSPPPPETTCYLMTEHGHTCGATLPMDRSLVATHLRNEHALGGDSKEMLICFWWNCHSRPIQRQSLIRHILSVHLGLLRWTCPMCWKTFARRGTAHKCHLSSELFPHA